MSARQAGEVEWGGALEQGVPLLHALLAKGLEQRLEQRAESLLCLCHLLRFRGRVPEAPPLIGVLGSANSGKSTLFNSIAGVRISKVTPIPHQTTGSILAAPADFGPAAADPDFLRPMVEQTLWADAATRELSGSPTSATIVPAWEREAAPFVLVDLPDVGTLDSQEERQVALRLLPWMDRVILLTTEESFAQAEHEQIERALALLQPERARGELYVVLNRRHGRTTDAEFHSRLQTLREFWSGAAISTLPHLEPDALFPAADCAALTAEAHCRVTRMLKQALINLAQELAAETKALAEQRLRERADLERALRRRIEQAGGFRRAFFSDEFRRRLDLFSPWRTSIRRLKGLLGTEERNEGPLVELLDAAAVQRHALEELQGLRRELVRSLERLDPGSATDLPQIDAQALGQAVPALVARFNQAARKDAETLLTELQQQHKIKDPLWSLVALIASTGFLLDLFIPSLGTLSTLAVSGALSALGLGGALTSDALRKLRTGRVRERFESEFRGVLNDTAAPLLTAAALARLDISREAAELRRWSANLPEVE